MEAEETGAMVQRQASRDTRAPIAAERDEPGVSQPVHELGPSGSNPMNVPPGFVWSFAETVTRQRRNNDVKCLPRRLAERCWISQSLYHLLEFEKRAWPPMGHDHWNGIDNR
jgi:hypothetical protein